MDEKFEQLGKVGREFLEKVVYKNLGADSSAIIAKPGHGFDNSVISLGSDKAMVITSDPLSIVPSIGMEESAWLTIHLLASDFTTSAVMPQFSIFDFNLPPSLDLNEFGTYLKVLSNECKRMGITIVGGHTGKYPGCDFTIVGGGVLLGVTDKRSFLTPAMIEDDDRIIMTKGAAIGATGFLSHAFPKKITAKLGRRLRDRARSYLRRCSTVRDSIIASSIGIREEGVTSMHDATEGGVLGGLYELSSASGKAILVNKQELFISEETAAICRLFGLDPLVTLSTGALIITCKEERIKEVRKRLRTNGIDSFEVGRVDGEMKQGLWLSTNGSRPKQFIPPDFDPYWNSYASALREGWN
jgi:hydrogenase maturation factor